MPFADVLSQVSTGTIDASGTDREQRLHNYLVESYEDFKKKCLDDAKRGGKISAKNFL